MTQDYTSTSGRTTSGSIARGFENHAEGESYSRDKQQADWDYRDGGSTTAEIAEISSDIARSGDNSLKVTYSSEERAKTASKFELPEEDEYYSSYWVYFDEDFSFNGVEKSGGKLPGLGSDEVPTGGDDVTGENGFSARYMWRYDGQAELYLYHVDKAGTFGDSVKFQNDEGEYKFFETGTWHNIIQRVKVNDGDEYNGEIDVWLDGEQVVDIDGVRLSTNDQGVDVFYLSTFYGGGSTDWLPPEDTNAYFDDFAIGTNPEDVGLTAADIRPPSANPDQRPVGDGVVRGIQEFQPETTEQELPDGSGAAVYHDKQWGDGYTATLYYTPSSDASNWTVEVRTPGPIEDIWNAEIVSYEDGVYTLRGTSKPDLDAGDTAHIRIKGEGHGSLVEFVDGQTVSSSSPAPVQPAPAPVAAPTPVEPAPQPEPEPPVAEQPVAEQPSPSTSSPSTGGSAAIAVQSEWNTGFVALLDFVPEADVDDWTLVVRFDGEIDAVYNGQIVDQTGDVYTIRGVDYNTQLDAGEGANLKIKGIGDASGLQIVGVTYDGAAAPAPAPTPAPAPSPMPEPIVSASDDVSTDLVIELVDTDTDTVITRVRDGQDIAVDLIEGRNVSFVVAAADPDFADQIGSVRLTFGDHVQVENFAPYALFGDASGDFRDGIELSSGNQQVKVEVFSEARAGGARLAQQDTSFAVQPAPAPAPAPTPTAPAMDLMIELVDTDTDAVIAQIRDGEALPSGVTDGRNVSIVVSASDPDFAEAIGSIRLTLGDDVRVESFAPYALFGDNRGDYQGGIELPDGQQKLMVEVFAEARATGQKLTEMEAAFEVSHAAVDPPETTDVARPSPADETPVEPASDAASDNDVGDGVAIQNSPFTTGDYAQVLNMSMQFYYAQYAGDLPDDFPIDWRGDSVLDDGASVGRDLSGGWFDAGDHVKFGLPMAATATMLAWGGIEFEDGYKESGAYNDLDAHLRHVTDYFLQAYDDKGTASVADDVFHAQVGDGNIDHSYWGAPEDMDLERPVYSIDADNPGTEVAAETSAALASASIFFRNQGDTAYADKLLAKAEKLHEFAETYQGTYNDSVPDAAQFYKSFAGTYTDELSWSSAWLYKATGDKDYLDQAEEYWDYPWTSGAQSWDNKSNGVTLLLAQETGDRKYVEQVENHIDFWINDIDRTEGTDTNDGLGWLMQWGSNRQAANTSLVATVWAKELAEQGGSDEKVAEILNFVTDQLDFMLGDNADGQSFVVGFGDDFPLNPHHRAASGTENINDPEPNEYILNGALVGGPSDTSGTYNDVRTDFITNEVATDYNAGFSGALAGAFEALDDGWLTL